MPSIPRAQSCSGPPTDCATGWRTSRWTSRGHDTLAGHSREVFGYLDTAREAVARLEDQLITVLDQQVSAEVAEELKEDSQ